jgi:hypothetical protein
VSPSAIFKWCLKNPWSAFMIALAAMLSGAEVAFGIFADDPPFGLSRGAFAALSGATALTAFAMRMAVSIWSNSDE